MGSTREKEKRSVTLIPDAELPELFRMLICESPVSTWIADKSGTNVFENEACRKLFGIARDEEVIGKYNIFKDDVLAAAGYMPQIRKVFEQGGSTEIIVDYDFSKVRHVEITGPTHKVLRGFLFALKDEAGRVKHVVVQHEDYTEKQRAERSLAESEAQYRQLVEMMNEGLARGDSNYALTYVNKRFADMLGYASKEMIGHTILDFVHPDDREIMQDQIARRKRGEAGRFELAWRSKDGRKVYTLVSPRGVFDEKGNFTGSVAVLTDITDRKLAEEALKGSEANYRSIFNAVNDAVFVHEIETGAILDVNDKMVEMYGYTPEEARRVDVEALSAGEPPYTQKDALRWIRKAVEGEPQLFEWKAKDRDGRLFWVEVNLKRSVIGGQDRLLAVVRDITERKQVEQRLRELEAHKRDFYRRTIQAATEGKLLVTEKEDIERIAGPPIAFWEISRGEDLGAVRHTARRLAQDAGMDENRVYDFVLTVGEATTNAYKHAGGGRASLHDFPDGLLFMVSDKGPGIEALTLPEVALVRGYSTAGSLGMGYKAILSIADKVYLATGPTGTTVAIAMRLLPAEKPMTPAILPDTWSS